MGTRVAAPPAVRRPRRWRPVVVAVIVAVAIIGLLARLDWRHTETSPTNTAAPTSSLPTRTVEAGAVIVKVQPRQLDAGGAVFDISFDTHSGDLTQDLVGQARLVVGETAWPAVSWSGDGPGGHHREGELRFTAAGPATGTATLTIDGLPGPVTATWDVGP